MRVISSFWASQSAKGLVWRVMAASGGVLGLVGLWLPFVRVDADPFRAGLTHVRLWEIAEYLGRIEHDPTAIYVAIGLILIGSIVLILGGLVGSVLVVVFGVVVQGLGVGYGGYLLWSDGLNPFVIGTTVSPTTGLVTLGLAPLAGVVSLGMERVGN